MKILIPIDGSNCSLNSVKFVVDNYKRLIVPLDITLFSVVEPLAPFVEKKTKTEDLMAFYGSEANRMQKKAQALLTKANIEFKTAFDVDFPDDGIIRQLERSKYDLVILGSRGVGAVRGFFVGSVTTSVVARTKVPTLILRGAPNYEKRRLKVAVAVDGSALSKRVVKFAVKHQTDFGENVQFTVVNVVQSFLSRFGKTNGKRVIVPPIHFDEKVVEEDDFHRALRVVKTELKKFNRPPIQMKLIGEPVKELSKFVKDEKIDLLVMGSYGKGRIDSVFVGSTVTRLAANGQMPILVVS